jgi:hypothetical protein
MPLAIECAYASCSTRSRYVGYVYASNLLMMSSYVYASNLLLMSTLVNQMGILSVTSLSRMSRIIGGGVWIRRSPQWGGS